MAHADSVRRNFDSKSKYYEPNIEDSTGKIEAEKFDWAKDLISEDNSYRG